MKKIFVALATSMVLSACGGGGSSKSPSANTDTGNIDNGATGSDSFVVAFREDMQGAWIKCVPYQSGSSFYRGHYIIFEKEDGLANGYEGSVTFAQTISRSDSCISPLENRFYGVEEGVYKIDGSVVTTDGTKAAEVTLKNPVTDGTTSTLYGISNDELFTEALRSDGSSQNMLEYDTSYKQIPTTSYSLYGLTE